MRSYDETSKYDKEELEQLNPEPWQIELLMMNPEYPHWGPHEDYMWDEKGGWSSRILKESWSDFGPFKLDDLNECVHFYFSVNRESEKCPFCLGGGYHIESREVVNGFYAHMNDKRESWADKLTQDEVNALVGEGRLRDLTREGHHPTAEEVNDWHRKGMGHDAINRHILIKARLQRLRLPENCEDCSGRGYIYTKPSAHVSLTLWWLHPRKGSSRGIEIARIEREEIPSVFKLLREAAQRNADRFSKIPDPSKAP